MWDGAVVDMLIQMNECISGFDQKRGGSWEHARKDMVWLQHAVERVGLESQGYFEKDMLFWRMDREKILMMRKE